jgi:hypothetical protein
MRQVIRQGGKVAIEGDDIVIWFPMDGAIEG